VDADERNDYHRRWPVHEPDSADTFWEMRDLGMLGKKKAVPVPAAKSPAAKAS
jgi:hypothetical protein